MSFNVRLFNQNENIDDDKIENKIVEMIKEKNLMFYVFKNLI